MKLELTCWSCGATLESRPMTLETEDPVLALRVVECPCHAQAIRKMMDEICTLKRRLAARHTEVQELNDQVVQLLAERHNLRIKLALKSEGKNQ